MAMSIAALLFRRSWGSVGKGHAEHAGKEAQGQMPKAYLSPCHHNDALGGGILIA